MVSILKEIDITQVFNHFAQKKCINHQRRKASSVCLHEDCWNSEFYQAFLCVDCNVDHIKKHGDSLRFDALFTDELFDEFDDYTENQKIKDNLNERVIKFEEKINELHREIEQWTKCQFTELKRIFESHLIKSEYFEVIKNMKKKFSDARIELSLNYEFKEKVKSYCTQIQKIQNDLNEVINKQLIGETIKKDEELNFKLENTKNNIQINVKNQVNQLAEYLIDLNKKSKSLKDEFTIKKAENTSVLVAEMPIVKNYC